MPLPPDPQSPGRWIPAETPREARAPAVSAARRLVVVSNRLAPPERGKSSSGGLAVAVQAAMAERGGIWFGWSGEIGETTPAAPRLMHAGPLTYATLDLERADYEAYYVGFANRVLWPLLHFRGDLVEFRRADLEGYLRVNRRFAGHLAPMLHGSDMIWVHDYHLIPLARELRRLGCFQPAGFFLHTPFPPAEVLRILPHDKELIGALLDYDVVGFQTERDLRAFRDYARHELGAEPLGDDPLGGGRFRVGTRVIRAAVFPIGIDVGAVAGLAAASADSRQTKRLQESVAGRALIIGVDRLDYSKGLPARFEAFEQLLGLFPETRGRVTFMQVAPPSRSDVPEYLQIRRSLEAAAGRINGRFAEFDWMPLRYLNKSFSQKSLTGFFRASRVAVVTPLRDGMNLVAKEFVASQNPDDPGVLVLSCFAGAAAELEEAVLVNPHDRQEITEGMRQALAMPLEERRDRWQAMMRTLRRNDITQWREQFVAMLAEAR